MRVAVVLLSAFTLWMLRSLLPAVLLGAWVAAVSEPLSARVARRLGGRSRAASALTLAMVLALMAVLALFILPIVTDVMSALRSVRKLIPDHDALAHLPQLFAAGASSPHAAPQPPIVSLARELAPLATEALATAVGAVVQLIAFLVTAYYLAIDGRRLQAGIERVSPFGAENTRHFIQQFVAVGRGIAVSMGLSALATAAAMGLAFAAVGVPRPMVLTALTFVIALLPIGAPIVWLPVCGVLLAHGRDGAAVLVASVGLVVVGGLIDHGLRPWLVRFGRLQLHPLLTLLGLFGGAAAFGAWGVFIGPIAVAMAATAMRLYAQRPIMARQSVIPGERVTVVSIAPPAPMPPAAIAPSAIAPMVQ